MEVKIAFANTGTYQQENIQVFLSGKGSLGVFNNIDSSFYSFNEFSYTYRFNLGVVKEIPDVVVFAYWDALNTGEVMVIEHVRVSTALVDYNQICLLEDYMGNCLLCNKYMLYHKSGNTCLKNPDYVYGVQSVNGINDNLIPCDSVNNSTKHCWDTNPPGKVECTDNSFLWINGDCPKCDSNCLTCSGSDVGNFTSSLSNCTSCHGTQGLRYFESSDTSACYDCQENCLSCPIFEQCDICDDKFGFDYSTPGRTSCSPCEEKCLECSTHDTCLNCEIGFEIKNGKCVKICDEGLFADGYQCFPCHENCESCSSGGLDSCLECSPEEGIILTSTNCPEASAGCCYKCPNDCSDCSFDNKCSSCKDPAQIVNNNHQCVSPIDGDNIALIDEYYFFKSKGEVVIIFNKNINFDQISDYYKIETDFDKNDLKCRSTVSSVCRFLLGPSNIVNGELTFRIPKSVLISYKRGSESHEFTLKNDEVKLSINFYDDDDLSKLETLGSTTSTITKSSFHLLIFNKLSSFLQLLKLTQHIEYLLYLDIELPANLYTYLKFFDLGIFDRLSNPFQKLGHKECEMERIFRETETECLYSQNVSFEFTGLLILFALKLVIKLVSSFSRFLKKRGKKSKDNSRTIFENLNNWFNFQIFILYFDIFFFEMSFFGFLQLKMLKPNEGFDYFSLTLGIVSLASCVYLPYMTFRMIKAYDKERITKVKMTFTRKIGIKGKRKKIKLKQNFGPLKFVFESQNFSNFTGKYFLLIIQIKNILYGIITSLLSLRPGIQITIHIIIKVCYVILIWKENPFKEKIDYVRELLFNLIILPILVLFLLLTKNLRSSSEQFNYNYLGYSAIVLFSLVFLIIIVFSWIEFFGKIKQFCSKKKKKIEGRKRKAKTQIARARVRSKMDLKELSFQRVESNEWADNETLGKRSKIHRKKREGKLKGVSRSKGLSLQSKLAFLKKRQKEIKEVEKGEIEFIDLDKIDGEGVQGELKPGFENAKIGKIDDKLTNQNKAYKVSKKSYSSKELPDKGKGGDKKEKKRLKRKMTKKLLPLKTQYTPEPEDSKTLTSPLKSQRFVSLRHVMNKKIRKFNRIKKNNFT